MKHVRDNGCTFERGAVARSRSERCSVAGVVTRVLPLALLVVGLAAADPLAPTPLSWPAGRLSLGEAVDRLAVNGNQVWLGDGVDDRVQADLPAVNGLWWDAAVMVCQTWGLRPDGGTPSDVVHEHPPGTPVPVGHGTLVLVPGPPPGLRAYGLLLAATEREDADSVSLWLRAEPRLQRGTLAWGRGTPTGLQISELPAGDADIAAARWSLDASQPAPERLAATVTTARLDDWSQQVELPVGPTVDLVIGEATVQAVLLPDDTVKTWEEQPLPERRPLLLIAGPNELLRRAAVRLHDGDEELSMRSGGTRSLPDDRLLLLRHPRAIPNGKPRLTMEGRVVGQSLTVEVDLPLPPLRGPVGPPAEAPTRMSWPASEQALGAWLALLAAGGNPVLPEVGVDTTALVAVAALDGGFWDGVGLLGHAAGLAPAIDPDQPLTGGAVRLVRRALPPLAACGPVAIAVTGFSGRSGRLEVSLRALIEPRLAVESFGQPSITWSSWATDADGVAHPVLTPITVLGEQAGQNRRPPRAIDLVAIAATRPAGGRLELTGQLTLPRNRHWRATTPDLDPGSATEVLLGGRAVEVTPLAVSTPIAGNQWGPGLLLRGLVGVEGVRYVITGVEGFDQRGEASRVGGMSGARTWLAYCRIPPAGALHVEILARQSLPPLVLPVRLAIPVPEGL